MNKMTHTKFNLNNFLLSISQAIDNTVEANKFGIPYSSKRAVYIVLNIAIFNNFSEKALAEMASFLMLQKQNINLDSFPFIDKLIFEDKVFLEIIALSDKVENNLNVQNGHVVNRGEIEQEIELLDVNDTIKENFFFLSQKDAFWFDLLNESRLPFFILDMICDTTLEISYQDLIGISKIFFEISIKYANMPEGNFLFEELSRMCKFYNFDEKDTSRMLLSYYFSNIGFLKIPQNILLNKEKLTNHEEIIIKSAPYHTKQILSMIFGFDDISRLASSVYEKLDGSGYPYGLEGSDLGLKNRILSVIVSAENLIKTKDRSYVCEELKIMSDVGVLDLSIVKDFILILKDK